MKTKTSWDLKLLYKGDNDPQIEKDLRLMENSCAAFEKKYKGKPFTKTPQALAKALKDNNDLSEIIGASKPWWYFALKIDLNSDDSKAKALATKYDQRITEAKNKVKFFGLEVAKISQKDQKKFLSHKSLQPYKYLLTKTFKNAKFNLSEGEEQLVRLLSQTSYSMWIESQQKVLTQQVISHKEKNVPIVEALTKLPDMPKKERQTVQKKINEVLKSISQGSEAELNAIYNFKKVMDKRRGFSKPYSSTIIGHENEEKSIETFVRLVSKNFKISHRFYKLHARLLKEKKITHADRNVKMGEIKTKFDFDTSVSMLRSILSEFDKEYAGILDRFLSNGQIDVYPKKGKKGGAYNWGMGKLPTFLLLNHVDDIKSLETLAHEMGHAIHTELSKKQPPRYRHYTTATAEVASTFFEQLMSEELENILPEKEKIILLHNKIQGDIATIFRQIAFFNFENEMHERIRTEGQLSNEAMAQLMRKHLASYFGPAVEITLDDGYFYVYLSHIRRFFYVYTYAYGQLISKTLYEKWKKDKSYSKKIKEFLLAGKSMSPEDIFKSISVDISKPSFFEAGLKSIEKDIIKLEKLTKK